MADITAKEVVEVCRASGNAAMNSSFLFWLAFVLRTHVDKEGKLARGPDFIAGIKKKNNPYFPFADPTANDVATVYFDFWFRSSGMLLPPPVNLIVGYIGLVEGSSQAIGCLQKALEMDATGLMTSEILNELAKRDAVPLAYRILSLYCESLSEQTRADVTLLLVKWLEYELDSTLRRLDTLKKALEYLA